MLLETTAEVSGHREQMIPKLIVPFQPFDPNPDRMHKLTSEETLCGPYVRDNIAPNAAFLMRCAGAPWMFFVPINGYTRGSQFTIMPWDDRAIPGPERLPKEEGEAVMFICGNIASVMMEDPENEIVIIGYNWSPRSWGQSGYQSIPRLHYQEFGLPNLANLSDDYLQYANRKILKREQPLVLASVVGGFYNIELGRILMHRIKEGFEGDRQVFDNLVDIEQTKVGFKGTRMPLKKPLDETLRFPGIHAEVIQPLAKILDQTAVDMTRTFTDQDTEECDRQIEEAMTTPNMSPEQRQAILKFLTRVPNLYSADRRLRNIEGLAGKYPEETINYLRNRANRILPEEEGPAVGLKNGLAYALAMRFDKKTGQSFLTVYAAVANGSGGIVEGTEGVLLTRPSDPFPPEEMAVRKRICAESIAAALNSRNGYHRFAQVEQVYLHL
ncbi:MAG: hypothetical protein HYW45_01780 [Candidatus Daviesbacteria bacterium]|nr:MAG: hypothetical protein HYW45_01780 [Candidatus Daviesbacteria bacterium]